MGTRKFVGAGGGVFDIDVPLSEPLQYQFDKGFLRLADGEKPFDEPEQHDEAPPVLEYHVEREPAPADDAPAKPKPADPKADWVAYAEAHGLSHDDADAMTKAALVEKFGK